MSSAIIYSDESGDLGWCFSKPYRHGGSSRFLTIASLVVDPSKKHLPKRLIKKLYAKYKWPTKIEKKWADMTDAERNAFSQKAAVLIDLVPGAISYFSITVRKENVQPHIRSDSNKLYNYMIGLSLLDEMKRHSSVTFVPDPRSIKVASGNSLNDYLQTKLWFEIGVATGLNTNSVESSSSLSIQFADMLAGTVQSHFEDRNSGPWKNLRKHIRSKTLFF